MANKQVNEKEKAEKNISQNIQFAYEQSGELTYIENDETGEKKSPLLKKSKKSQ